MYKRNVKKYSADDHRSKEKIYDASRHERDRMKHDKVESYLYDKIRVLIPPREDKMQETIQVCIEEMYRQLYDYEERTGFWTYLSDIFRFEGLSIFGLQMIVFLVCCLGISTLAQLPEMLPAFMPLFGLALVPVLYRNQAYGMCEMEAATRASGAQIILAKLILAGGANLICMTAVLCLEISVLGAYDGIVQIILYAIVPFLVCVVVMLRSMRMCRHRSMGNGIVISIASCVGWGMSARIFPWLYEASATGVWMAGFIICAVFLVREVCYIIQMRREGKMYGIIN